MKDNFNIHDWNLKTIKENSLSDADRKAKRRVEIILDNILKEFPELNDRKLNLKFAISTALVDISLEGLLNEDLEGYSKFIGKTKGLTPEELDRILTKIASSSEEIEENKNQEYKVEYWYQYRDDYDFDTVNITASNEREAIEIAKKQAPRGAKDFKIIK